jgi:hypothetical protein
MAAIQTLRRLVFEAALLVPAFFVGWLMAFAVGGSQDSIWDTYMSSHGGMAPAPEFVAAHRMAPHVVPTVLWTPILLVLLYRLYVWNSRRRAPVVVADA